MRVLKHLEGEPFASVDELAHALGLRATIIAQLVADLEASGMIEPVEPH